jgi:hypothetical protein
MGLWPAPDSITIPKIVAMIGLYRLEISCC